MCSEIFLLPFLYWFLICFHMVRKYILYDFNFFLHFLRFDLWITLWPGVLWTFWINVLLMCEVLCMYQLHPIGWLCYSIFPCGFADFLLVVSVVERSFFMYFEALLFCACICRIIMSSWWTNFFFMFVLGATIYLCNS